MTGRMRYLFLVAPQLRMRARYAFVPLSSWRVSLSLRLTEWLCWSVSFCKQVKSTFIHYYIKGMKVGPEYGGPNKKKWERKRMSGLDRMPIWSFLFGVFFWHNTLLFTILFCLLVCLYHLMHSLYLEKKHCNDDTLVTYRRLHIS